MTGGLGDIRHELELDNFEHRTELLTVKKELTEKDPRKLNGDIIPDDLKKELNLPQDMSQYEIDFTEVRVSDA